MPENFAASPVFVPSVAARLTKPVNVVNPIAGGVWPPSVLFPQRQATTPDPGKSGVLPSFSQVGRGGGVTRCFNVLLCLISYILIFRCVL